MRASRIEGVGGGSMGLGSNRAASSARGSSKPAVKKALKAAKKAKPLAEPKSAVRVKPAAKPLGKPLSDAQYKYQAEKSMERASNDPFRATPGTRRQNAGKTKSFRKFMSKNPNVSRAEDWSDKLIGPKKNTVKINTNPFKTTGFSNLKRKVASMDTPVNRARAKAKAKALKAANAGSKKR